MEAKNFETRPEMIAWEKELERRIAEQVGPLPDETRASVYLSEHGGEWAMAALELLSYALANDIHVDSELVKPAIDFWAKQFFPNSLAFMFAGRWLNAEQIEEIFEFPIMWKNNMPEDLLKELLAASEPQFA